MKTRHIAAGLALLAGGLGLSVFLVNRSARSADHLDSPSTRADATIDINDVYTWMDGNNFVVAVTLFPAAPTGTLFSTAAQYVIHTTSGAAYGATTNPYDIICTFTSATAPQTIKCWGGTNEYVTGDASQSTGLASADGKFKVFAGMRADPFFFNLDGFKATVADVEAAAGSLTFNDAGCPALAATTVTALDSQLMHAPDGGAPTDFFATLNALAIVVSLDKSLVSSSSNPIVSVWAATHK